MQKFWMVIGKKAGNPTQRHYDKGKAFIKAVEVVTEVLELGDEPVYAAGE